MSATAQPSSRPAHEGPGAQPLTDSSWLVSRRWDLWVFGGSAGLAFGLLLYGRLTGRLAGLAQCGQEEADQQRGH